MANSIQTKPSLENYKDFEAKPAWRHMDTSRLGSKQKVVIAHLDNGFLISHGRNGSGGRWGCEARPELGFEVNGGLFQSLLERGLIECFFSEDSDGVSFCNYWRLRKPTNQPKG